MTGRYYLTGVQLGMLQAFTEIAEDETRNESYGVHALRVLLERLENDQYMCSASNPNWRTFVREMFINDKAVPRVE